MTDTLLHTVRAFTQSHANAAGLAQTPIAGLTTICAGKPGGLDYAISRPLVCLVLQGSKQVTMGAQIVTLRAGDTLLITADVPTVSQIIQASADQPYLSLVLDLDHAVIADLVLQMDQQGNGNDSAVQVTPTEPDVADCAHRLFKICDRPATIAMLYPQLVRELHYWLLSGALGPAIRQLGWPESHTRRIARAIALLRSNYHETIAADRLAAVAGMSPSSFYHHFRAVTALSPLQFQKQLRLIEARRMVMSEGMTASSAAYAVGYESVSQFTREYRRMFGLPPAQDRDAQLSGPRAAE
ncbi:AraC family transcriptional regulator [Thalassospira marina]|uniref:AraC family transcriptional regulator n=1 Tax=Thalassospira marina TaxID=2048283 RepID=A0ABN5FNT1_9PROT|nr:AraC family transcriptional regulator [Thalassospira marina]AUG55667.1 AraC family transcriptional regulator [Thalassospira marina]